MMNFLRRFGDLGINGVAARWYDNNSRKHRIGEMRRYASEVASQITDGSSVLEVAPGPGYLAIELAKMGNYRITGMDISKDLVEIARRNAKDAGVEVEFRQGSVSGMPFDNGSFDFIICTAAFKNFKEPRKALSEMHRVLKRGGKALIVDMKRDTSNRDLDILTDEMKVKGIEAIFMKLTFKYFLRKGAYTKDEFDRLIAQTDFGHHSIEPDSVVLSVRLQKLGKNALQNQ